MDDIQDSPDGSLQDGSREPLSSAAECLIRLLHTEELADLTLIFPNTEQPLKVHRLVLAMWSPVFKAMIFGPMSEGDSINLPDDPPEAFKWFLEYMYGGVTQLPNVDLAVHVYMLANKYQMDHLKTVCSKFLMDSVTAANVPQVMNVATLLEDDGLTKKCTQILDVSPDNIFLSPSVGLFSSESLQQLLSLEIPISSETVIFKGLIAWGNSQLKLQDEDITSINLRRQVDNFLPHIRFLTMTHDEFVKNVLPEYILTVEELTPILLILAGVQGVNIPKPCSDIRTPRKIFDISQLQSCQLVYSSCNQTEGTLSVCAGEERELLASIKCKIEIYITKLEYASNIGDHGLLIVRDSTGQEIDSVEFNGKVVEFTKRLKLIPGQEYSFVLKGITKTLYKYTYSMKNNEILSGNMKNNYYTCLTVYYWK